MRITAARAELVVFCVAAVRRTLLCCACCGRHVRSVCLTYQCLCRPLGLKKPLDLTQNRAGLGLRWQIPFVIMDAIYYGDEGRLTIDFTDSRDALALLDEIAARLRLLCI